MRAPVHSLRVGAVALGVAVLTSLAALGLTAQAAWLGRGAGWGTTAAWFVAAVAWNLCAVAVLWERRDA